MMIGYIHTYCHPWNIEIRVRLTTTEKKPTDDFFPHLIFFYLFKIQKKFSLISYQIYGRKNYITSYEQFFWKIIQHFFLKHQTPPKSINKIGRLTYSKQNHEYPVVVKLKMRCNYLIIHITFPRVFYDPLYIYIYATVVMRLRLTLRPSALRTASHYAQLKCLAVKS